MSLRQKTQFTSQARCFIHGQTALLTQLDRNTSAAIFDDGTKRFYSSDQVHQLSSEGHFYTLQPKSGISSNSRLKLNESQQAQHARVKTYLDRMKQMLGGRSGSPEQRKHVSQTVARAIGDPNPPSASTLWRWYQKSETSQMGSLAVVVPNTKRERRVEPEVYDLAMSVVAEVYLNRNCSSIHQAYERFLIQLHEEFGDSYKPPCYNTFAKWIREDLDCLEVLKARQGKRALHKALRTVFAQYQVHAPLARVEVDAANINIGVVDDDGRYLGTVMIYLVFDCFTRSVLGYKLQIGKGETASSVIDAYIDAIGPKPRSRYPACHSDYPMYGRLIEVFCDGGPGYTAKQTATFLAMLDVIASIVETGKGWKKPFVESFIRTLRIQCLSQINSYCGKYKPGDPELEVAVEKQACMTLSELKSLIDIYIVDTYHHRPHSGLDGRSPYEVWTEHFNGFNQPPLPDNFDVIQSYRGEVANRRIQDHKGIQIKNIFYNSRELHVLYLKLKTQQRGAVSVTCEFSTNDISEITVTDPTNNTVIIVPATTSGVEEGMSLAEFQSRHQHSQPRRLASAPAPVFGHNNPLLDDVNERQRQAIRNAQQSGRRRTFAAEEITEGVHRRQQLLEAHLATHQHKPEEQRAPHGSPGHEETASYLRGDDIFDGGWGVDE